MEIKRHAHNFIDLTGQKYNRLTPIKYIGDQKWLCKCDCGNEKVIYTNDLRCGKTKSCGCFRNERVNETVKKHCMGKTKIYRIWADMKGRCFRKTHHAYKHYGERGITVCEKWKNDFLTFYEWSIKNGYKEGLSIDRINNDGNYEPSNCRWVTQKEQCNNKRTNLNVNLNKISNETGILYGTLLYRYHHNLDLISGGKKCGG